MANKNAVKSVVSDREKAIIMALANSGVESPVIAKAWGIPTQAVAAYKAWATMRG